MATSPVPASPGRASVLVASRTLSTFNWKENVVEPWLVLIIVVTLSLESDVNFAVYPHEWRTHVGILSVMNFEIRKSIVLFQKVVTHFQRNTHWYSQETAKSEI